MKHSLLLLLALVLSVHAHRYGRPQKAILASGLETTHILYPFDSVARIDPKHNQDRPDYIGYGAKWVWRNVSENHAPEGDVIFIQSLFDSECETGTLIIAADDEFTADINFGPKNTGNFWQNIYKFPLNNLKKGQNTLHIKAKNNPKSAAGMIYAITQSCKCRHRLRNCN